MPHSKARSPSSIRNTPSLPLSLSLNPTGSLEEHKKKSKKLKKLKSETFPDNIVKNRQ